MYKRNIVNNIINSLKNNPVVLVNGARQVGKTTLVEELVAKKYPAKYLTFDDHAVLFASSNDAYGFLDKYEEALAIDEVQRNPDIFMAIKRIVDTRRKTGQFLLTGSANVLTIPKASESLAGRIVLHTMWPLSHGEIIGVQEGFINWAFNKNNIPKLSAALGQNEIVNLLVKGGYPRSVDTKNNVDRNEWMQSYINTILQRDVQSLSNIEGLQELPNILSIIAERVGNLINLTDISRMTKLNQMTIKRYYTLLQMVFLVVEVPAWSSNRDKRLAKASKVFLNDSGLVCYFKQQDTETLLDERSNIGPILENFVVMEIKKQIAWSELRPELYHFRTQTGHEVDVVLEGKNKKIVGIEIKAATQINDYDLKGMRKLQEVAGEKFVKGIILYTGKEALALGDEIYALPINVLWDIGS